MREWPKTATCSHECELQFPLPQYLRVRGSSTGIEDGWISPSFCFCLPLQATDVEGEAGCFHRAGTAYRLVGGLPCHRFLDGPLHSNSAEENQWESLTCAHSPMLGRQIPAASIENYEGMKLARATMMVWFSDPSFFHPKHGEQTWLGKSWNNKF